MVDTTEHTNFRSLFDEKNQAELRSQIHLQKKDNSIWASRAGLENIRSFLILLNRMRLVWTGKSGGLSDLDQNLMEIMHGAPARILGDKTKLPWELMELGFLSPRGVIISPSDTDAVRIEKMDHLCTSTKASFFFAKPVNGTWQRDLVGLNGGLTKEGIIESLTDSEEDYLIQEYLPTEIEWRYIRFRNKGGQVYVARFKYALDEDKHTMMMPLVGDRRMRVHGVSLTEFVNHNLNQYPKELDDQDLAKALDIVVQMLTDALEKKLGISLPLLSFDVGVTKPELVVSLVNQQPVDLDELQKHIVFYETQTTPHPWQMAKRSKNDDNRRTYFDMWRLFFHEHASEIVPRARIIAKRMKVSNQ